MHLLVTLALTSYNDDLENNPFICELFYASVAGTAYDGSEFIQYGLEFEGYPFPE